MIAAVVSFLGFATPALSQSGNGDEDFGMAGAVGPYPIAMIVTVHNHVQIVAAHYSYASRKKPIALTADVDGENITLAETNGTFHLHLTTNDKGAKPPLTFYTSTGLEGTWTNGDKRLPVQIGFNVVGAVGQLKDCEFYPQPRKGQGGPSHTAHFPDSGCAYTPDQSALEHCIASPFSNNKAVAECVIAATRPCREDQVDTNFCVANITAYLDQTVRLRIQSRRAEGGMTARDYQAWTASRTASCRRNSEFSPDGSGYHADIDFCMSFETMRLLQKNLVSSPTPFSLGRRAH